MEIGLPLQYSCRASFLKNDFSFYLMMEKPGTILNTYIAVDEQRPLTEWVTIIYFITHISAMVYRNVRIHPVRNFHPSLFTPFLFLSWGETFSVICADSFFKHISSCICRSFFSIIAAWRMAKEGKNDPNPGYSYVKNSFCPLLFQKVVPVYFSTTLTSIMSSVSIRTFRSLRLYKW